MVATLAMTLIAYELYIGEGVCYNKPELRCKKGTL